ncbi:PAS-domain containing protein [Algirhabdus cladophorae]|uniref:PAS-domain containing protein n=1 Tax=Algirhabdus cladophorae TaxID=3377108 RepID=UPI003B848FAA
MAFVFDDTKLIDASEKGYQLLRAAHVRIDDTAGIFNVLSRSFPDLGNAMADIAEVREIDLKSEVGSGHLHAELWNGLIKITLRIEETEDVLAQDAPVVLALEQELLFMREVTNETPFPMWQVDSGGHISWANTTYIKHVEHIKQTGHLTWPLPHIFGQAAPSTLLSPTSTERKSLEHSAQDGAKWFDVHSQKTRDGVYFYATPADEIVSAQENLSSFTQTLTKTFAQLTQGLAIFDSDRNLMMFNPALVRLTNIPAEKLCVRPSLWTFLDSLREQRMIPEPKDYHSWRDEIRSLETAAETDSYCKVWQLPSGLTYRVTGRPHPGGAIALLIENITEEISLTRRFNAHLEQNQAILDCVDEAMVVFSPSGVLVQCNKAYREMWDSDPDQTLIEFTATNALKDWRKKTNPSPFWGELQDFIYQGSERSDWVGTVTTLKGQKLDCRVRPLMGGSTLVSFVFGATENNMPGRPKELPLRA